MTKDISIIVQIKRMLNEHHTHREISNECGVGMSLVSKVFTNKIYADVEPQIVRIEKIKLSPAERYELKNPDRQRPRWNLETMVQYLNRIKILEPKPAGKHYEDIDPYCWIYPVVNKNHRYAQLQYKGKRMRVHQWAYETFIGPRNGLYVLHRCDVEACFNPGHLYLGTQQDNMNDIIRRERKLVRK